MYCSKCGCEIEDGAGFCGNCGNSVQDIMNLEPANEVGAKSAIDEMKCIFYIGDKQLVYSQEVVEFNKYFSRSFRVRGNYVHELRCYLEKNNKSFEQIYYGMSRIALEYAERSFDYAVDIINEYHCNEVQDWIRNEIDRIIEMYKAKYFDVFIEAGDFALKNHAEKEFLSDYKNARCLLDFVKFVWKDVNHFLDEILKKSNAFQWVEFVDPVAAELLGMSLTDAAEDVLIKNKVFESLQNNPYSIVAYRVLVYICNEENVDEVNELMSYFGVKEIVENLNLSIFEDISFQEEVEKLLEQCEAAGVRSLEEYVSNSVVMEMRVKLLRLFVDIEEYIRVKSEEEKRKEEFEKRKNEEEKQRKLDYAVELLKQRSSEAILKAIRELDSLLGYKNSLQLLSEAREQYDIVRKEEEEYKESVTRMQFINSLSNEGKERLINEKDFSEKSKQILQIINLIEYKKQMVGFLQDKFKTEEKRISAMCAKNSVMTDKTSTILVVITVAGLALGFLSLDIVGGKGLAFFVSVVVLAWIGQGILDQVLECAEKKEKREFGSKISEWTQRLEGIKEEIVKLWSTEEMRYFSIMIPQLYQSKEGMAFLERSWRENSIESEKELFTYCNEKYVRKEEYWNQEELGRQIDSLEWEMKEWKRRMC